MDPVPKSRLMHLASPGDPGYWACLLFVWSNLALLDRAHPSSVFRWINLTSTQSIQDIITSNTNLSELAQDIGLLGDGQQKSAFALDAKDTSTLGQCLSSGMPAHCLCTRDVITVHFGHGKQTSNASRPCGWYTATVVAQLGHLSQCSLLSTQHSLIFTKGPQQEPLWGPEVCDLAEGPWKLEEKFDGLLIFDLYTGLGGFAYSLAKANVPCLLQAFEVHPVRIHAAYSRFQYTSVSFSPRGNALALTEGGF